MANAGGAASGIASGAAAGSVFGPIGTVAGAALGALGGLGGLGGSDTPLPPKNMTATSGGTTGGAFVFGDQNKSSPWVIVALVGVLVVGALVWIGLRKRKKR